MEPRWGDVTIRRLLRHEFMNRARAVQTAPTCVRGRDKNNFKRFEDSQHRDPAWTVLCVPHSLDEPYCQEHEQFAPHPPVSGVEIHLTEFIYSLVLESQLPHKIVNLISQLVIVNNKLDYFEGELTFQN